GMTFRNCLHGPLRRRVSILSVLLLPGLLAAQNTPGWIAARGRVVPGEGVVTIAAPTLAGEPPIVAELLTRAGATVTAGAPLARLTSAQSLQRQAADAADRVPVAEAALEKARERRNTLDAERSRITARREALEARLQRAQRETAQARASVAQAAAQRDRELAQLRANSERLQALRQNLQYVIDEEDPPRSERVDLRLQQSNLEAERAALEAQLATLAEQLARAVEAAEATVATAQAAVAEAEAQRGVLDAEATALDARESVNAAAVNIAQAELAAAEAAAKRAQVATERATLTAPLAGRVVKINARAGEAVGPEGLLQVAPDAPMFVEAEVYLDDIRHVAIGQSAEITSDVFAGSLVGEVVAIEPMIGQRRTFSTDPASFVEGLVQIVRLRVDEAERLRQLIYAPVTARIQTNR
ncbi:MAG: efflux RND transporter periplasmic adaptor subunit, partial [Opitutales bacterium]